MLKVASARVFAALLTLNIAVAFVGPYIQGTPMPSGRVYEPYSAQIACYSDSPQTLRFALTGGDFPPGLSLSASGLVSGTPTRAGDYSFSLRATDANGQSNDTKMISIANATFFPSSSLFFNAYVGTPASFQITVSNAVLPLNVGRTGGALPPGMFLSTTGAFSGTPTLKGVYKVNLAISDASGRNVNVEQQIQVLESPIRLTSSSPPAATLNSPYTFQLTASGGAGSGSYTFQKTSGELPPGLTFNDRGLISGIPSAGGTYTTAWRAADLSGASPPVTLVFTVSRSNLMVVARPPTGLVNRPYDYQIPAVDGLPPIQYSFAFGQLPPGLTFNAVAGRISGIPTQRGNFDATVRVSDAAGATVAAGFTIIIDALEILSDGFLDPTLNSPYAFQLNVRAGTPPYVFSVVAGALPPGLILSPSGRISGVPTSPGPSTVTFRVVDSTGASAQLVRTLTTMGPRLTISGVNLPKAYVNADYSYRLPIQGGLGGIRVASRVPLPVGLTLSTDGLISGRPTQSGSFVLAVRVTDAFNQVLDESLFLTVETLTKLTILDPGFHSIPFGEPIRTPFRAAAGNPPYRWSIREGSLPSGLSLDSSGEIQGRAIVGWATPLTLRVTDASGAFDDLQLNPRVIGPWGFPNATMGAAYSGKVTIPGVAQLGLDTSSPGGLPEGLTYSGDGTLSGTPTTPGRYRFGILSLSSTGAYSTHVATLEVRPADGVAFVRPFALPGGSVGEPFNAALGPASTGWTIASGILPPGLSLSTDGVISGTPLQAGAFGFTVKSGTPRTRYYLVDILPAGRPTPSALVNAADYRSEFVWLNPLPLNSIVAVFGSNLAPPGLIRFAPDRAGRVPNEIAGTRVLLQGFPAPLLYLSPTQLSAITYSSGQFPGGETTVVIERDHIQGAPLTLWPDAHQLAVFTQNGSGSGLAAALNQDSSLNSISRPARRGEFLVFYLTGCGPTTPPTTWGAVASSADPLEATITAEIGGRPANVLYSGSAPGLISGVCQINVRVPAELSSGLQSVRFSTGGASSQSGVQVAIE